MPAKSKKHAGKMAILYKQGKISKKTRDEFLEGVDVSSLPEKVKKPKRKKRSK